MKTTIPPITQRIKPIPKMVALIEAFSVTTPLLANMFKMKTKSPYQNIHLPTTFIPRHIQWTGLTWECITRLVFKPKNLTASAAKTAPNTFMMMSCIYAQNST